MTIEIAVAAIIGGIIPSLLKLLHWATSAEAKSSFKMPANWPVLLLVVGLQVILALIAVWLLAPHDKLSAAAFGYGAPDLLLRVFGSLLASNGNVKGVVGLSRRHALSLWLRL